MLVNTVTESLDGPYEPEYVDSQHPKAIYYDDTILRELNYALFSDEISKKFKGEYYC